MKHLVSASAAIALLALASPSASAQTREVSVMSFGGAYQAAQREGVFKPYAGKTGGKVNEQEYGGEIAKIKAMVQAGAVTVHAVDVDAPTLRQGCDEGLFERLDYAKIGPKAEWLDGTATECGVGTIVYATILAYDGAKLKDGPTKIGDLFDTANFPGKRGLWKNPVSNIEFALLADGVKPGELYKVMGTKEGIDRAFKKLDTIKSSIVWWEAGAQAPQLLASGEVVMTTAWNGRIHNANKEGKQFKIVWDNQILDSNYWVIPKGVKDQAAAYDFIKFAVEPQSLAGITKHIPYGPVRKTANQHVAPADAANLPTSPANMTSAVNLDNNFWGDKGEEIRKRFTTWLTR